MTTLERLDKHETALVVLDTHNALRSIESTESCSNLLLKGRFINQIRRGDVDERARLFLEP